MKGSSFRTARVIALTGLLSGFGGVSLAQAQTAPDTTTTTMNRDDDGGDFGWIGLLGLAGLAGLMRRDRSRDAAYQTAASRT